MIKAEAAAARKLIAQRILARRHLLDFTQFTHQSYKPGWVHRDICNRLERFAADVRAEKSPRLMLLVPPRHGKSELASTRFPAWYLGDSPEHEIINVGYNVDLPLDFSRKILDLLRDPHYQNMFPDTRLDPNSQSAEGWKTTRGGGFRAAGVGGGITGKGAHILIVDDPIKNQMEADNAKTRGDLDRWFQSTAYTRLAPGGGVLFIETWWHDDDLAGRLMQRMRVDPLADQYDVVKYPALAEEFEYRDKTSWVIERHPEPLIPCPQNLELLRVKGDCLHRERYDEKALQRIKANVDDRVWSALYQQNPVPDEGMFLRRDYFRYQNTFPSTTGLSFYTAWDFAITQKQMSDWTVGVTLMQDERRNLYVVDMVRIRADTYGIIDAVLNTAQRWTLPGSTYVVGFEDGQIWKTLKPVLEREMYERKAMFPYQMLVPLTDKVARARPLQGVMQQGRLVFPEEAPWLRETVLELLRFPAGQFDDVVDAFAWCVRLVLQSAAPVPQAARTFTSWRDNLFAGRESGSLSHMAA